MNLYAFDVDHTLEISQGPVTLESLYLLRNGGHVVGLCGNWGLFTQRVREWWKLVSFMNVEVDKKVFLESLKRYVPANRYILVGNIYGERNSLGFIAGSYDSLAAEGAGWEFIREDDFANGKR